MTDSHLLGLFSEILEFTGPNPHPHYAVLLQTDAADERFLKNRLNIVTIPVNSYNDVPILLRYLNQQLQASRCRIPKWSFALRCPSRLSVVEHPASLEIVRGTLKLPATPNDCIAISAGIDTDGSAFLGRAMRQLERDAQASGLLGARPKLPADRHVVRYSNQAPVYLVAARARSGFDERDLRRVSMATLEMLQRAHADGFIRVRMQVLAAGRGRVFPARYSVAEMIRAYGNWMRSGSFGEHGEPPVSLTIQVVDPEVLLSLQSGRFDVHELLHCRDTRFWVEVLASETERQMLFKPQTTILQEIAAEVDIVDDRWQVQILPSPTEDESEHSLREVTTKSLAELGVVAGSTLRFRRQTTVRRG